MKLGSAVTLRSDNSRSGVLLNIDDFNGHLRVSWWNDETRWELPEDVVWVSDPAVVEELPEEVVVEDNILRVGKVQFKHLAVDLEPVRHAWADDAQCYGESIDEFFYGSEEPTARQREILRQKCEGCPVMWECRYEAVRNLESGWWGGMSERERMEWAVATLF